MSTFEKIGTYRFITEQHLLDFRGRVTIPMIGNYLMHAASNHATQRGFGFNDMTEKQTTWVLSRLAIEVVSHPKMPESLTLHTWIDEVGHIFTSRSFELTDSTGTPVAYANSSWAAIDLQTRRPVPLDAEALGVYVADRACPIERPGKIADTDDLDSCGTPYRVKYSDLDINGHLSSIKYMECLLDLFDLDMIRQKEVKRFEISYLSEGLYGMSLMLRKKETEPNVYTLSICHEEKTICRAKAIWI
jgi:acyl-ACP thioesterase